MTTTKQICDKIGRAVLAEKLGVGRTAIGNAVTDNSFPAKWFVVVRDLCAEHEIDCPEDLFAFNKPEAPSDQEGAVS